MNARLAAPPAKTGKLRASSHDCRKRVLSSKGHSIGVPLNLRTGAERLASRYIWWEPAGKTLKNLSRFLAHSMNLATWNDQMWLESNFTPADLFKALSAAPAGTFTPRSWNYWHIRLGRSVPPLPQKQIPA